LCVSPADRRIIASEATLQPQMPWPYWDRYAFSIGGVDFAWIDVVLAAMIRGDWSTFERRLAEGLACAARADRENAQPSLDAVDEAAVAFRYERDLISAADITGWLDRMDLTSDEWSEYLIRDLLRRRWADELDDVLDRGAPSSRDLLAAASAEGICSGSFEAFERTFAGHAALVYETDAAAFHRACEVDADGTADSPVTRLAQTHAHWLSTRPARDIAARIARASRLESAFVQSAGCIGSNGRLKEIVDTHRLGWTRLAIDTLSLPTEHAAREAILCVREDRLSLHDVAALSRTAVARSEVTLDDFDPQHRDLLLAAEPGSVVGPLPAAGRFEVASLVSRTAPSLDDPAIAARARALVVDTAQHRAARDHVKRAVISPAGPDTCRGGPE
jgi:hypothetical protein